MRNEFEKKIARQLRRKRVLFSYEKDQIPYILCRYYIPDFTIFTKTGKIYIELKGYFRPEAKAKMIAVKKLNPQLDIRILFYAANKKNIKWADKHGFRWAVGEIPEDWLKGL